MISSFLSKYIWVINLLLIALLSYRVALIVNGNIKEMVSPVYDAKALRFKPVQYRGGVSNAMADARRSDYDVIIQRNIFGISNPYSSSSSIDMGTVSQTTLNIELLATVVRSETEVKAELGSRQITKQRKSRAILKNRDNGKIKAYIEGDLIDIIEGERVRLLKVDNCVALVRRARRDRELIKCKKEFRPATQVAYSDSYQRVRRRASNQGSLKDSNDERGISKIAEGTYEIDRKFLEEKLDNLNELLTQARVLPQDDGLKLLAIRRNSLFYEIGLRNGDTLHRINDVALNDIENALGLFEELRYQSNFTIDLTRRGKRISQYYTVK